MHVHTKTHTWTFVAALFIAALKWKQAKCPSTGGWINKWWYIVMSGFPRGTSGKASACQFRKTQETQVLSLRWEDPPEKEMTTHPIVLAYKISWIKESGRLHAMDSQRVGCNWACTCVRVMSSLHSSCFALGRSFQSKSHCEVAKRLPTLEEWPGQGTTRCPHPQALETDSPARKSKGSQETPPLSCSGPLAPSTVMY